MRYALKVLGRDTTLTIPACCWTVIDGPFPHSAVNVPLFHTAFASAAAAAAGIKAAYEMQGREKTNVVAWAGDGGTYDIGIQALSASAERNDDIIYVCYDNEAYMNTGIQRSAATPRMAWTTTTPVDFPKEDPKKDMISIMAAHRIPYVATGSIAYLDDLLAKLKKVKETKGTRFLLLYAPCPTGWKHRPEHTVKISRLAVKSRIFPLIEIENGMKWRITVDVEKPEPVFEYLKLQGRFRHLTEDQVKMIQDTTDKEWKMIVKKVEERE
jgi:pyruvate/2-oxoacid:ferredoxin oxidoreductase beta subunit